MLNNVHRVFEFSHDFFARGSVEEREQGERQLCVCVCEVGARCMCVWGEVSVGCVGEGVGMCI